MAKPEMRQTQSMQTRQELRLFLQLEQANVLEMPEDEFNRLTVELENSPLFKKLYRKERVIGYQRYRGTDISAHFYELNEEVTAGGAGNLDVESLLSGKEDLVHRIKRMGLEKFKRYFLYPEPGVSLEETARQCGLEFPEAEKINDLINELSVMSEFHHPSGLSLERGVHYSKVASVEKGPQGFVIGYLSPAYARGKYSIDYQRFEELRGNGVFGSGEAKEMRELFRKLELINGRKDTLTRVLQGIVQKQALYFESGNGRALLPFSQKELAEKIGVAASSVSRAISSRSLETPLGEEKALKDFFPHPRTFRRELVKQLLGTGEEFRSDEAIRVRLEQRFGVSISRRLVADLRKELRMAAAGKRRKTAELRSTGG